MHMVFHPFHLVSLSPWPILAGLNGFMVVSGMVNMFYCKKVGLLFIALLLMIVVASLWWRDVVREGTFLGDHGVEVVRGLMAGMLLFIVSEVFFFLSFFWAFFHSSLSAAVGLGSVWPPTGIISFDPFQIPLLNTIILLSSGVSVTWAHQAILFGKWSSVKYSLMVTWLLGVYFLCLQGFEYFTCMFDISDSVFGSVFFMATGFHGFHVVVGTLFLIIMWSRSLGEHFSTSHHFGLEAAAWYWHFVDVVWLFLFVVVYWWGGL
uniref:Cytochrome c oxidase subunit 3 n=1 Tax=Pholcus sp. HCP-2014 TaxID=1519082 RepID=A0A0U1WNP4_9ARAC|nr:cytochrome c oxidase subunit III [Pholcus sp. HCP-2014]